MLRALREAAEEDRRWESARLELPSGQEIAAWDSRLIRPAWPAIAWLFGDSTAWGTFGVEARARGADWLGPVPGPWQGLSPVGLRAGVGTVRGCGAAYVAARTRRGGVRATLAVLSPEGERLLEPVAAPEPFPPRDLVARLEALVRRTPSPR